MKINEKMDFTIIYSSHKVFPKRSLPKKKKEKKKYSVSHFIYRAQKRSLHFMTIRSIMCHRHLASLFLN